MPGPRRYKAFISYSHGDERWARWLQRALEGYRLPKKLRKRHPRLPARLFPIFRDRDELASGHDLSESIQQAIADSDALVVICSPAAATSRWVAGEIRHFQATGDAEKVFCLLVAGQPDPGASDCAFPKALLEEIDGTPGNEPLAADVRSGGDGKRNAMLKIAAGLLGVGVDELRRRDAQRQAKLWSVVAAGSLLIAALTIGLAIAALIARRESEVRRYQAETLIGFMLGDLRGKLEPIGKLDLLDSIGDQAMTYFAARDNKGTPQEMLDRAKALRQIGDVRFNQGRLEPALQSFRQSLEQARVLHEAEPDNNDYLYELGQAEFWVGYVAWQRNDLEQALASMQAYMRYSQQLSARAPDNADYRMELAFAHSNLGSVARAKGDAERALVEFQLAAEGIGKELAGKPADDDAQANLAEIWSWIGSTLLDLGRLQESEQASSKARDLLQPAHDAGKDPRASARFADFSILLADVQIRRGNIAGAGELIDSTRAIYQRLVAHDPDNASWRRAALIADFYRLSLLAPGEWLPANRQQLAEIITGMESMIEKDATNQIHWQTLAKMERLRAQAALWQGDARTALASSMSARELVSKAVAEGTPSPILALSTAQVELTLGASQQAMGDTVAARQTWASALKGLGAEADDDLQMLAVRRLLAISLGQQAVATRISVRLAHAGFADPRFQPEVVGSNQRQKEQ